MGLLFDGLRTTSFDSFWYWVLVALIWMMTGNRVLGVPWDMVLQMRQQPKIERDVEVLLRLTAERQIAAIAGRDAVLWAGLAFVLTMVFLWGFVYGIPLAQGVFFLLAPLAVMWGMVVRAAKMYLQNRPTGNALYGFLDQHRWHKHLIMITGLVAVALWGGAQSVLHATFLG